MSPQGNENHDVEIGKPEMGATHTSDSDDRSSAGDSESGVTTCGDETSSIKDQLTKSETKLVFRLRLLVISVLIVAGAGVAITMYLLPHRAAQTSFQTQYDGLAVRITDVFQEILGEMALIGTLGVQATSYAIDNGTISWPSVTVSNFQSRASGVRSRSGALYVSINPVVATGDVTAWEDYVQGGANYWM